MPSTARPNHTAAELISRDPSGSSARTDFIQIVGRVCRRLGLPRSLGQIYGLLFFASDPMSLDDIAVSLGISKASASLGTRQLAAWGAIRQVWVPGDRRDFFEIVPDLTALLRSAYLDFLKPRLAASQKLFTVLSDQIEREKAAGQRSKEQSDLVAERIRSLSRLQKRIQAVAPLIEKLL